MGSPIKEYKPKALNYENPYFTIRQQKPEPNRAGKESYPLLKLKFYQRLKKL
jgi:hypothetical protein